MAEFPALPLWTDAYLADTTHLTTIEHGAYLLLLMAMWRTKTKDLPNDDKKLARFAKLSPAQWARIKPTLWEFFDVDGDRIRQGRLTDEANVVRQHSKSQSNKARARWLKTKESNDAAAMPGECPHTHTQESKNPLPSEETPSASQEDLDALLYKRGKALLGKNAGGQITKLRVAVGLGQALQVVDDASRKESPAEYVAGCIRNKGNGRGDDRYRRPSAVQDFWARHCGAPDEGNDDLERPNPPLLEGRKATRG